MEHVDDKDIRAQIEALVEEERTLRDGPEHTDETRDPIRKIEKDRDEHWELIRERDAKL